MLVKNIRLFPWLALSAILVPGIPSSALAQDTKEVVEEESEAPEPTPDIEETITVIGIRAGDDAARHQDEPRRPTDRHPELRPGCAPASPVHPGHDLVLRLRDRFQLFVLQHARHPADPHQHDLRRRPSQRPGRARCLFQQLPRLHEHGRQHPDPAWSRHLVGRLAFLRRIGELRQLPSGPGSQWRPSPRPRLVRHQEGFLRL